MSNIKILYEKYVKIKPITGSYYRKQTYQNYFIHMYSHRLIPYTMTNSEYIFSINLL